MTLDAEKGGTEAEALDFDTLVARHSDFVYNVAFRIMGNPEDSEDVAQEALLSAFRAFDSFRGQSRVTTWVYRITMNAALMKLRKTKAARATPHTSLDDVDLPDWTRAPDKEGINSELRTHIQEAIESLDPDLRAALVLRDVESLSNTEAAEILGISVAALKSRLHRARVLVREYLAGYVEALSA
ncbi:MAG: RNA polymerase sigma factor [SAR202 cluster bacterium]|nr:RNA polymerase sigma factor [SAR202 cluster bacterium]